MVTEIESECAQSYRGKTAELEKFLRPGLGRGTGYKNQRADVKISRLLDTAPGAAHTHTPLPP